MPYIKKDKRWNLATGSYPVEVGDLNYLITTLILNYLKNMESYQKYNDVMGVLACIQAELYRRKISPYEDKKIFENGDVY